jgi:hypothetical protein
MTDIIQDDVRAKEKIIAVKPLFPHLPERLAGLEELAENLWWSWNPGARMFFKTFDRQAWKKSGHNPDKMLRELPRELLEKAGADAEYIGRYDNVMEVFRKYMQPKACDLLKSSSPAKPIRPRPRKTAVAGPDQPGTRSAIAGQDRLCGGLWRTVGPAPGAWGGIIPAE